jgi:hypothetical protein
MRPAFIIIAIFSTVFCSCFRGTYNTLQRVSLSASEAYEIKSMAGCCGCRAILYNVMRNGKIAEQFVVETNCSLYEPTKHLFTVDTKGRITSVRSLVAVTDSSFTLPATEIDKAAFLRLDSIYKGPESVNKRRIVFADITGFKEGGQIHMPLGVKIAKSKN